MYLLDFPLGLTGASLGGSSSPRDEEDERKRRDERRELRSITLRAPLICCTNPTALLLYTDARLLLIYVITGVQVDKVLCVYTA